MGRKVTPADIQVEIAKGAFRPHTALSNMALSYFQSDKNYFARTIFPLCPVSLSADNYYIFSKEDLLRDSWKRKPAYGKVEPAVLGENGQTYACQVDQMIVGIDQIRQTDLIRRQGPSIRDPRQQRTRMIATQASSTGKGWRNESQSKSTGVVKRNKSGQPAQKRRIGSPQRKRKRKNLQEISI